MQKSSRGRIQLSMGVASFEHGSQYISNWGVAQQVADYGKKPSSSHFTRSYRLYLFHILLMIPAISLRSQSGSSTSKFSPCQSSSC